MMIILIVVNCFTNEYIALVIKTCHILTKSDFTYQTYSSHSAAFS